MAFHFEVRWRLKKEVKYLTHPHTIMLVNDLREERMLSPYKSAAQHFKTREAARQANFDMEWSKHPKGKSYLVRVTISERIVK